MAGETRLGRTGVHTNAWREYQCYEMLPHMACLLTQTLTTWPYWEEARKAHSSNKLRTKMNIVNNI